MTGVEPGRCPGQCEERTQFLSLTEGLAARNLWDVMERLRLFDSQLLEMTHESQLRRSKVSTLEDETTQSSRNIGNQLSSGEESHLRRIEASITPLRKPKNLTY